MKVKMFLFSLLIMAVGGGVLVDTLVNPGVDATLISHANEILANTYQSFDNPLAGWGEWVSSVSGMWLYKVVISASVMAGGFFYLMSSFLSAERVTNE